MNRPVHVSHHRVSGCTLCRVNSNPERIADAERIARTLREQVAQGIYRPGDEIPAAGLTARAMLVNPHRIHEAYGRLCAEGILADFGDERRIVRAEGPALAQAWLARRAREEARATVRRFRSWGLDATRIKDLIDEVLQEETLR